MNTGIGRVLGEAAQRNFYAGRSLCAILPVVENGELITAHLVLAPNPAAPVNSIVVQLDGDGHPTSDTAFPTAYEAMAAALHETGWLTPLLDKLGATLDMIDTFSELAWHQLAGHLTCAEVDAVANMLLVFGRTDTAEHLLESHAYSDEPGDSHHIVATDVDDR